LSQEGEIAPPGGVLAGAAVFMALAGGLVLLAISFLTVASGGLRWLTSQPIRGDFELISIGSGLGVLAALGTGGNAALLGGTGFGTRPSERLGTGRSRAPHDALAPGGADHPREAGAAEEPEAGL
jgi:hypothetical protein